jgi:hypothetical protein
LLSRFVDFEDLLEVREIRELSAAIVRTGEEKGFLGV